MQLVYIFFFEKYVSKNIIYNPNVLPDVLLQAKIRYKRTAVIMKFLTQNYSEYDVLRHYTLTVVTACYYIL